MYIFNKYNLNEDLIQFELNRNFVDSKQSDKNLEQNKYLNSEIEFKINEVYKNFLRNKKPLFSFLSFIPNYLEKFLKSILKGKTVNLKVSEDYSNFIQFLKDSKKEPSKPPSQIFIMYEFKNIEKENKITLILDLTKQFKNLMV